MLRRHSHCHLIFLLFLLLTGCGFYLRGKVDMPPLLNRLFIQTQTPYSPLTRILKQNLSFAGVTLVDSAEKSQSILEILSESTTQQLVNVGSTQQTRQYNLNLTLIFQITDKKGNILVEPTTLTETRVMTTQSNQILGDSNEASSLYQQMRQSVSYNMVNLLASKKMKAKLSKLAIKHTLKTKPVKHS